VQSVLDNITRCQRRDRLLFLLLLRVLGCFCLCGDDPRGQIAKEDVAGLVEVRFGFLLGPFYVQG